MAHEVAVALTTYNQPDWLERVLTGFACQSRRDFDIIVADDGSTEDTRAVIDAARARHGLSIEHVWQADEGFRKCRALNMAILASTADYLIFTDGDCVPRSDFVAEHLRLRESQRYLSGGYCKLPMAASQAIDDEAIQSGDFCRVDWLRGHGLTGRVSSKLLARPGWQSALMNALTPVVPRWHGHNASAWRADILRVNGFDERISYGGEDLEFGERLTRIGVRGKQIRHSAIVVHLDHPRGYVREAELAANARLRAQARQEHRVRTSQGIAEHAAGSVVDPAGS